MCQLDFQNFLYKKREAVYMKKKGEIQLLEGTLC